MIVKFILKEWTNVVTSYDDFFTKLFYKIGNFFIITFESYLAKSIGLTLAILKKDAFKNLAVKWPNLDKNNLSRKFDRLLLSHHSCDKSVIVIEREICGSL